MSAASGWFGEAAALAARALRKAEIVDGIAALRSCRARGHHRAAAAAAPLLARRLVPLRPRESFRVSRCRCQVIDTRGADDHRSQMLGDRSEEVDCSACSSNPNIVQGSGL